MVYKAPFLSFGYKVEKAMLLQKTIVAVYLQEGRRYIYCIYLYKSASGSKGLRSFYVVWTEISYPITNHFTASLK